MKRVIASAGIAAFAFAAASVDAGSLALKIGNLDSGWVASWDSSHDPYLSLSIDKIDLAKSEVWIEKFYNFTEAPDEIGFINPVVIVFQQNSHSAVKNIAIADEQLINNTGYPWNQFIMTIQGGSTGTDADAKFDPVKTNIGGVNGFSIDPFLQANFTQNNQVLTIHNGYIGSDIPNNLYLPGTGRGELYIHAAPTTSGAFKAFALKEQPVAIPLPPAMLSGLVLMGGLAVYRRMRRSA